MLDKIKSYIKEKRIFEKSDKVIVGISGGADSVCLLCVLIDLKEDFDFSFRAVHINHGLRGQDAKADEKYVKELCAKWQVPLTVFDEDVAGRAKRDKLSLEQAGRIVRRERLEVAAREWGGAKIALAHHKNDHVETMLLNLFRGTGVKGLGGIRVVNGDYVRPLLCVTRKEIEHYLEKKQLTYCIDQTNLDDDYTRNRIRNHLIPYIEETINPRFIDRANCLTVQVQELQDYMEDQVKTAALNCVRQQTDAVLILKKELDLFPYVIRRGVLYQALCRAAGGAKDIEAVHVEQLLKLLMGQVGKSSCLPYRLTAHRCYEGVRIGVCSEGRRYGQPVKAQQIKMSILERNREDCTIPENPYTKWFDYDIIKNTVEIRNRLPGDYITIDAEGHTQKMKKYFINEKVPKQDREQILLAADGSHIMWIAGYRQNPVYMVTENTRRILEIELNGGTENDRSH